MKAVGYQALIDTFRLDVLQLARTSWVLQRGSNRLTRQESGRVEEVFPVRYAPGDHWTDHLLFALKHEGVNLEVLAALFRAAPVNELTSWIAGLPTSRYTRMAWFFCEWLLDRKLDLPDLTQGNYVPLLDAAEYYSLPPRGTRHHARRQRVINNLPGTRHYCPLVRRTTELKRFEGLRFDERATEQVRRFPAELVCRAAQYLYVKETKSSYAIERLTPDQRRTARFVTLLQEAGRLDCFRAEELIRLQHVIVEERYAARGFRDFQNYVGQSLGPARELIHYVPPKPEDLPALMEGWMTCCRQMQEGAVHPVVTAAVAGFGFVFLHPFEDGNGRLHRFLIHHALAMRKFGPPGVIFPVSATMLKQKNRSDAALEAYSREIGRHVEYRLDDRGDMRVLNETGAFYRYPDLTSQAEALFGFIRDTIATEMVAELEYLAAFDEARRRMRAVVDMPDRRMDLFVRLCLEGKGRLSKSRRACFHELSDQECRRLQTIVRRAIARIPALGRTKAGGPRGEGLRADG